MQLRSGRLALVGRGVMSGTPESRVPARPSRPDRWHPRWAAWLWWLRDR